MLPMEFYDVVEFREEDGGKALIATIWNTVNTKLCGDIFIKIESWDNEGIHKQFRVLEGKKLKVTIEEIG